MDMTSLRYWILPLIGIMILTSCAGRTGKDEPVDRKPLSASEQLLANGIKSYEDGEYKTAAKSLQDALNAGLPRKTDSAKAHKYLAFIACGAGSTSRCRDEFRKAFEDDPSFTLDAAEAGHPIWGPVYRGVRDQIKSKEKPR
jgi:Tfp pilus assembly protein PilF